MKVTFEVDIDDFYEYGDGESFKDVILSEAIKQIVLGMYGSEINPEIFRSTMKSNIDRLIKEKQPEIIEAVISNIEKKVMAKKRIREEMPKVSELSTLNKENEEYFMTLIDRAIAKRFK